MKLRTTVSSLLILPILASTDAFASQADKALDTLLDQHWAKANEEQVFFRSDPDAFRLAGVLPDVSETGRDRREAFNASVLKALSQIPQSQLDEDHALTYRLFKYERLTEAESYQQPDYLFPMNIYAGYHTYFAAAPDNMSFLTKADFEQYLKSLKGFPKYNHDEIANLTEAVSKGMTHYCGTFNGYEETISRYITDDAEASVFYQPFVSMPEGISKSDATQLRNEAKAVIQQIIMPEYQRLYDFFTKVYMPECRTQAGIASVEGGNKYYQYLIHYYTTTNLSADAIHELGLAEVKRIRAEMDKIIAQVGFKGSFHEFVNYLRTDDQFYAKSEQALLERASYITRKMAGQLPKWFTVLPRTPFDIKSSPGGGAYYVASDGTGTTAGTYFIGTNDLRSEPLYNLEALTYHEAEPGHHLQTALALEMDIPEFRKTLYHSAYGEGWGLYAESLGKDMGFYQDPYSDFGRLTYEAWRACRLVVDTGIHAKLWTRQQAIDYLADNTALTLPEVENQIDRYISWPGQALSYKLGELKILELRSKAKAALGDKFDIREFHNQILKNGSLPLDLLEEMTMEWIAKQKS